MVPRGRRLTLFFILTVGSIVSLLVWKFASDSSFTHISNKVLHLQTLPNNKKYEYQLQGMIEDAIHQHKVSKTRTDMILRRMMDELRGGKQTSQKMNPKYKGEHDLDEHSMVAEKKIGNVVGIVMTSKNRATGEIMNPHDFKLIINEPDACKHKNGSNKNVFMLVVILTVHGNFEDRKAIRETWGSPKYVDGRIIVSLFLLANTPDNTLHRQVVEESKKYHDIIMEDFHENYRNLTIKTIMGLKWMTIFCPQARYILKADDDMYISYENIAKHLDETTTPTHDYVVGYLMHGGPIRDVRSKWYMSKELYPKETYPPFCSGTTYAMSGDIASKVYATSLQTPYLHLEDVFFAICLEKLGIVPNGLKGFHNTRVPYSYCTFKRILTAHQYPATEKRMIWGDLHFNTSVRCL